MSKMQSGDGETPADILFYNKMKRLPITTQDICAGIIADFHDNIYNCGAFDVYLVLYCQQRKGDAVEITLNEIAKLTGFSVVKITRILNALVEKGIIKRKYHKQGKRQKYVIL